MNMKIVVIDKDDIYQYKKDMQEAFQLGAIEGGYPIDEEIILPETHIDESLNKENSMAYKIMMDGKMVGGAIVVIDKEKKQGYLDFIYVKHGTQGKGIGKFMWFEIERLHPEVKVWETCTPYFEKRNIHFYINVCGFHAVEFFNAYHKNPDEPCDFYDTDDPYDTDDDCMFAFRKTFK